MKPKSLIFLDTNVCIFRTLANLENPKINYVGFVELKKKINDITNTHSKCKLIISDIVWSELKSEKILFNEIKKFCKKKLRYPSNSSKTLKVFNAAKKSMDKACNKYSIESEISELIKDSGNNLVEVDKFYLQFPDRLKEITGRKINYLKGWMRDRKIRQRVNNLPEESDRLLLCQAVELSKYKDESVGILSNDSDFTGFITEISEEFSVEVEDCFS